MKKIIVLLISLACLLVFANAQTNYSFRTINKDNGLVDNYVEQVFEDSRGFMWFATHGGLSRYDGHSFENIEIPQIRKDETNNYARNFLNSINEDNHNNLWICTLSGVYLYNLQTNLFSLITYTDSNKLSSNHVKTERVVFDNANNAWIATQDGLTYYNTTTKKSIHYLNNPKDKNSITNNYIEAICIDSKGDVWIGTRNGGLDIFDTRTAKFIHYSNKEKGLDNQFIRGVCEDEKKNIWVITVDKGLYCMQYPQDKFQKVPLVNPNNQKEITSVFRSVIADGKGKLWISTQTDGLIVYSIATKKCRLYYENNRFPQRIASNSVQKITRDKQGNIWIATHGGGASVYSPMFNWFEYYAKSQMPNSLPGNIVSSFCEDHNGNVWVGTDGNGFAKLHREDGSFDVVSKQNGLLSNSVLGIGEIKPDIFAIGTWAGGLNVYDAQKKTIKQYAYTSTNNDGTLQHIYYFEFDKKRALLWCNTFSDGLQLFDCNRMAFLSEKEVAGICPYAREALYSYKMITDNDANVWIAEGTNLIRITHNKAFYYTKADSAKKSTSMYFVTDLHQDKQGTLWISSFKGVTHYDKKDDCFRMFDPNVNLKEGKSLLEDSIGNMWITTGSNLYRYSLAKKTLENVSQKWGIPEMQYFRHATMRTRDGHLYFGGLNGFIELDEHANNPIIEPSLYVTKLIINDVEQTASNAKSVIKKDISYLSDITLPYDLNYITIEFAAMNFVDNDKSKFKYVLKGFNDTWIETAKDRRAQFTSIPPGNYTFLLKTTNSQGNWIDKPLRLQIIVLPPWWKTFWFRLLLACLMLFAFWEFIKYREAAIKRQNKQLEALVDQRTKELRETNEDLHIQKSTIQQQYEDIKENHFVIELKNTQLQDALEMKDKLMTVIAHDFKNPLATLQGYTKLLQKKVYDKGYDDIKKNVDGLVSSSTKLMDQMIGVLEWSLGNDKAIVHIPVDTNIDFLIAEVLTLVNESAQRKNINIKIKSSCKATAFIDPRMISAVIRNLVINSIKFTPDNGSILIRVTETEHNIMCDIEDTGKGMDKDFVKRLLSNDELRAEDYQSGFGLMICKTFIKRNKGSLEIESEINKGTKIKIKLPKGTLLNKTTNENADTIEQISDVEQTEMSMLIIDDNKDIIGYLSEVFSDIFTVYGAYDGKNGLQIAHNVVPDIVLCDVAMPVLDGIDFCKHIKSDSLTNHIPVILLSAKSQQNDQVEGLQSGADDYVTKPFDATILKQKVHSILKNRKLLHKHFTAKHAADEIHELPESYNDKITNEATALIMANLSNPDFTVDILAKHLCLSRSQLYRKFIGVIGQTPKEYMLTLKFERAIEMLKTNKYRISDIAYELGFSDAHYFSLSFSQRFGVAPSNYFEKESNK